MGDSTTTEFNDGNIADFNNGIIAEFRANGGRVGGMFEGAPLLLLTTTGAKSGQARVSPLAYHDFEGRMFIVGANRPLPLRNVLTRRAGADSNPHWVHNLRATPRARIEVGVESHDVTARELPADERDAVFEKVVTVSPTFGGYQANISRVIPLFELHRA